MASKHSQPAVISRPIIGTRNTAQIGAQSMRKASRRLNHGVYASGGNTHRGGG